MPFCVSQLEEQQGYKKHYFMWTHCLNVRGRSTLIYLWYPRKVEKRSGGKGRRGGVIGGYVGLYTKVGLWSIMSVVRGKIVGREIIMTVMTKIRLSGENSRDFNTANSSENINLKKHLKKTFTK